MLDSVMVVIITVAMGTLHSWFVLYLDSFLSHLQILSIVPIIGIVGYIACNKHL